MSALGPVRRDPESVQATASGSLPNGRGEAQSRLLERERPERSSLLFSENLRCFNESVVYANISSKEFLHFCTCQRHRLEAKVDRSIVHERHREGRPYLSVELVDYRSGRLRGCKNRKVERIDRIVSKSCFEQGWYVWQGK